MKGIREEDVYRFIFDHIDTVPHLEALLQLWNTRPQVWPEQQLAKRLFLEPGALHDVIRDLIRHGLVAESADGQEEYSYRISSENDAIVSALAALYRSDLIRVSTAIHSKASSDLREFARAFQFGRKGKT